MTSDPRARDLDADLIEQLTFLGTSCASFDRGVLPESKRIAVAIRVLVHDTTVSRSLLQQLAIKNELEWADSAPVIVHDPNISARSPGMTGIGLGQGGMVYTARSAQGIVQSRTTRYVDFNEWWTREVVVDAHQVPFTRKALILALANKDGGAHIDKLQATVYALIHENSSGFIRFGHGNGAGEAMPSPIYASARTIAEELFVTLRRANHPATNAPSIPALEPETGAFDSFTAGTLPESKSKPIAVESLPGISKTSFKFDNFPAVTFQVIRTSSDHYDPTSETTLPDGWLQFIAVRDSDGEIVHQSGSAGPTAPIGLPPSARRPKSSVTPPGSVQFTLENFPGGTFSATRSEQSQTQIDSYGDRVTRGEGTVDFYLTLDGMSWELGSFQGPL